LNDEVAFKYLYDIVRGIQECHLAPFLAPEIIAFDGIFHLLKIPGNK